MFSKKAIVLGLAVFVLGTAPARAEINWPQWDWQKFKSNFAQPSTPEQRDFLDIDRDHDGYISFSEFTYAYTRYYKPNGDDPIPTSQRFAAIDKDGDNRISFKEFSAGRNTAYDAENYTMKWVPDGHANPH